MGELYCLNSECLIKEFQFFFFREKWEKAADVCCMRTNILPQFHAILHYFTLKDPSARGCVRPSCIAYVTQNQIKMYHLKKEIMSVLNTSAQIFKHTNMRWMRSIGHKVEIPVSKSYYLTLIIINLFCAV